MLSNTPPTYVGTKRRTGPMDFHINKMRALNLSAKYMKKVEAELRGLPGTFNDLPVTPLMNIGEMVDSSAFDQVNRTTADALKGKRMRKMASQTAKQADDISLPAKRATYVALVLSILLYGSECWAITARMRRKLRSFHRFCCRTMFGIKNMHQVKDQKTTTAEVLEECGLRSLDTYMARRRLRWLGHVWRMDWDRLPRKLLSSWVYQARPLGRPCKRWGESIEDDLKLAGLKVSNWHETAEDRDKWREIIDKLGDPKKRKPKKSHKNAKKSGK